MQEGWLHRESVPSTSAPRPSRCLRRWLVSALVGGVMVQAGCASAPPVEIPPVDAAAVQREAEEASRLDHAYRLVFTWELQEPGVRLRGRGVARVEPPYRARLDLFAASGDRIAAAALDGDDLEVPAGLQIGIPPAPMLWGALGVFRPGPGLYGATATRPSATQSTLHYRSADGGSVEVVLGSRRIERMNRVLESGAREELQVRFGGADERFPRDAVYRDVGAVRELRITMESVEHMESFPPEVWLPGAGGEAPGA